MPAPFVRLWKEQKGQDIVEYALILLLILLMAVASTNKFSHVVQNMFQGITNTVSAATTGK